MSKIDRLPSAGVIHSNATVEATLYLSSLRPYPELHGAMSLYPQEKEAGRNVVKIQESFDVFAQMFSEFREDLSGVVAFDLAISVDGAPVNLAQNVIIDRDVNMILPPKDVAEVIDRYGKTLRGEPVIHGDRVDFMIAKANDAIRKAQGVVSQGVQKSNNIAKGEGAAG